MWKSWVKLYCLKNISIWDIQSKDHLSESLKSILKVRDIWRSNFGIQAELKLHSCVVGGKFLVAKAYEILRDHKPILRWVRALMGVEIIPKHRIIVSLAGQQKLATIDNILKKGMILINRCCLCEHNLETHTHLFFDCPYSSNVFKLLEDWIGVVGLPKRLIPLLNWVASKRQKRHWKNKWIRSSFMALTYYIWSERNRRLFAEQWQTEDQLAVVIKGVVTIRLAKYVPTNRLPAILY